MFNGNITHKNTFVYIKNMAFQDKIAQKSVVLYRENEEN